MIYIDTTAIEAVNDGRDVPDAFYHKSTLIGVREWVSSSAWRGHNTIKPEAGFKTVEEDWVTSDWGDAVSEEHGPDATERKLKALEKKYGDIFVIYTPTSNVFSTGMDVLARDASTPLNKGKLVATKTRLFTEDDGSFRLKYHATDVISYNAKTREYTVKTGGWNTMTTARRITDYTPDGWHAYRRNWITYLSTPHGVFEIPDDGVTVKQ